MQKAGYYDLEITHIMTLEGRRKGKAKGVLFAFVDLAREYGFTGVKLCHCISKSGGMLLSNMVHKHKWVTDGIVPARVEVPVVFSDNGNFSALANDKRITDYDNKAHITKIKSVKEIVPWMKKIRKNQWGELKKEYIINNDVYVILQWSRTPRKCMDEMKESMKRAILPGSLYSPVLND